MALAACLGLVLGVTIVELVTLPAMRQKAAMPPVPEKPKAAGLQIEQLASGNGYDYDRIATPDGKVFHCLRYWQLNGATMHCVEVHSL